jgi:hypothetical protein
MQDGDAFVESVIWKVEGFGPKLCHRTSPISPDFLNGFTALTLDLGARRELMVSCFPRSSCSAATIRSPARGSLKVRWGE